MCGSRTIPIEAALMAADIAPDMGVPTTVSSLGSTSTARVVGIDRRCAGAASAGDVAGEGAWRQHFWI
ncbi:MAG: hypothetical protein R3C68_10935 [Myxococcota bacterium]